MTSSPPALEEYATRLAALGWASDLLVAGSLSTGDYVPGVSDLDLVALVTGPVDTGRQATLTSLHRRIDEGIGSGLNLGCAYVDSTKILNPHLRHPTWTHGQLVRRGLSLITRAELVRHGYPVFGRRPSEVFPAMSDDDLREATRAELTGYWAWAARRPWIWLNPAITDLGLTAMARARHTLATGTLLSKTQAIEQADAPAWLINQLRARRKGEKVTSPRLRTALIAWRDARRTVTRARANRH
jgi:hypothetical protein